MRSRLFLFFSFLVSICEAQEIKVLEKDSKQPLSNVAIYNKDKSHFAVTDSLGVASLSEFEANELLTFSSVSHQELYLTKKDILKNNGVRFTGT